MLLPIGASALTETQKVWSTKGGILTPDGMNWTFDDPDLWQFPKPHIRREHILSDNQRVIFRSLINTDQFGRRLIPIPKLGKRLHQIFLYGCSFVFGQGLNDDQTLAFHLAKAASKFQPISFAAPGYGAQQMLTQLQRPQFKESLPEKSGKRILVYPLPHFHVRRVIGAEELVIHWTKGYAYFYLNRSGELIRDGDFETGRPITTALYRLLWKSGFTSAFKLYAPFWLSKGDYELTAAIIEKSFRIFKDEYEGDDAFVVLYPGAPPLEASGILVALRSRGIKVLDYSGLLPMNDPRYVIPGDVHPTSLTNEILAERLRLDLGM